MKNKLSAFLVLALLSPLKFQPSTSFATAPATPTAANRTLPKVDPPRTALEFSPNPTVQEIFRARVFEEPLVPIGGEPTASENAALAEALVGYAKRTGPDDFSGLTGFLQQHPKSPWAAALLTGLGLEYYNTAHYSLCLDAWAKAWSYAKDVRDAKGKALMDRAAAELAYMYARLGRMIELEALLKSVDGRHFIGSAREKIGNAREGLSDMKNRPEIAFRCGPLALHRIKLATDPQHAATQIIHESASTQKGFSLTQVAELSKKVGLNYQMAFRPPSRAAASRERAPKISPENRGALSRDAATSSDFIVPSVVHWKVGHYAALIRQESERYLVQDPTFQKDVWATKQALEAETSGYFLVPPGPLPTGWRAVETKEGETVWGKGDTGQTDPKPNNCQDQQTGGSDSCSPPDCPAGGGGRAGGMGMAVSSVHLSTVNLSIVDTPVGYSPPVGPAVHFTVRYNDREAFQPAIFSYGNLGPGWTCDWTSYITDNPSNTLANVNYYARGGGTRAFTGFDTNTQSYAFQQYDQTRLTRTGPGSYEMMWPDGSKLLFSQSDGSVGTVRKIFLTQVVDVFGNALTLTYDSFLRVVAITDAIGQVTTLDYGLPFMALGGSQHVDSDAYKITKVTDPFGRFATFDYNPTVTDIYVFHDYTNSVVVYFYAWWLTNITDVIGLTSKVAYENSFVQVAADHSVNSDLITSLVTPYGTTTFNRSGTGTGPFGTTRVLETVYADGSRDRVEYNRTPFLIPTVDPASSVPQGMATTDGFLMVRNTYYWSRNACAIGYGDYSKAKVYHWLHTEDLSSTSGILESTKEALEGRVWYDYAGQAASVVVGPNNKPSHVGRVLDDGSTQLYTYAYDGFGHVTNRIDPVGRTFSYIYSSNGIDLLEVRQTRAGNNELLSRTTYNPHHLPLTTVDAAGQTNSYTYNSFGQLLTRTNPKNETTAYGYDTNGYLIAVDGPLPGPNDVSRATYDGFGRVRTKTDESGYSVTFDYDALNRLTRITFPDSTFQQYTYSRLDPVVLQDRAGRQTLLEYSPLRQLTKRTDPLNRVTIFQWCSCGDIKSLTDPMGRTTTWHKDVQNRLVSKQYGDGSQVTYNYENAVSRLRQVVDEKLQIRQYTYNRDDTLNSATYANTQVPTPPVSYTYDPNYQRRTSMSDGTGITLYGYGPVTPQPSLNALKITSVDGPLPNDTIIYGYDELGRRVSAAINGVAAMMTFDAAGRMTGETNALGSFTYIYDGASGRRLSEVFPNGQTAERSYGNDLHDQALERITYQVGATPISEFVYGRDLLAGRIATWSQQAGAQPPSLYTFGYDGANQLLSATVTKAGSLVNSFAYNYDLAGNRLSEKSGGATNTATYNALNQLSTTATGSSRTNEWDAKNRLVAVNAGNQRTEFTYDGLSRLVRIRQLTNGSEASLRWLVWSDNEIWEERDAAGTLTKRFFAQGVKVEAGPTLGAYFYARDHLGSIRELTDGKGNLRARYGYDPSGGRTLLTGDANADFGFAGMFWSTEAGLAVTRFRAYDAGLGRWLSRDPLSNAEVAEGPNLYSYVADNPVNAVDPLGLCYDSPFDDPDSILYSCPAPPEECCRKPNLQNVKNACDESRGLASSACNLARATLNPDDAASICSEAWDLAGRRCLNATHGFLLDLQEYYRCLTFPCVRNHCFPPLR
jgi:RHS repeat-associated protein